MLGPLAFVRIERAQGISRARDSFSPTALLSSSGLTRLGQPAKVALNAFNVIQYPWALGS